MQPSPPTSSATPTPSSALSAFLRGIERRAFVFAQVQCGRDDLAEQALARAMHAFQSLSALSPLSAWPAGFWSLLLAQAELGAAGDSEVPELARLGSGPRAALLLRMVAGLDFAHAAQVLGVGEDTYRFALQRALQQLGENGVSYAALSGLRERLHRQVKTLPAPRIEALAALRERVLTRAPEPGAEPPPAPAVHSPWLRRALWLLLALLLLAFAATFLPRTPRLDPGASEALPPEPVAPAPTPAARAEADTLSHPDFAQLAEPAAAPLANDLALLSWLAHDPALLATAEADAGAPSPAPAGAAASPPSAVAAAAAAASVEPAPPAFAALPPEPRRLLAPLAAAWPQLDAATRERLLANTRHWLALAAADRRELEQRIRAWDALPAPEKAQQRAPFAAWAVLPASEQAQVRATAARFDALPAQQQQALRAAFAQLPAEQRRDWWLGPGLGADFSGLQPLVAFVPDGELAPVLAMLRGLGAESRAELALLARRLPVAERDKLRHELLAAPPAQRPALVRARLR